MAEFGIDVRKASTIREYLYKPETIKQIQNVLPKFLNPERFLRTFYTAMLRNPALQECSIQSMLSAMIDCAALGLEPVMGKAALVPYKGQVQFQPMYRGLIDLARRTGNIAISAHNVHQNDQFDIEFGDNERIIHKPVFTNRGAIIGAYTVWTFPDGMKTKTFMPIEDIHRVRDRSQAWRRAQANPNDDRAQQTPWVTDPGEMNVKTVIKRHAKLQPCSIEMDYAVQHDDHVEYGAQAPLRSLLIPDLQGPEGLPEAEKTDLLEKTMPEGTDRAKLDKYLELCAQSFGHKSTEDFRASLARSGQYDEFWQAYAAYLEENKPKPRSRKTKEPAPPPPPTTPPSSIVDWGEETEPSFVQKAEKYISELTDNNKTLLLKLYGIKPGTKEEIHTQLEALPPGYQDAFLQKAGKALDSQNAK